MKLFDSHCHLYMEQFDADRDAVLARMREAQMGAVVIGVDYASSARALELAKQHDFLWASVGLHPNDNPTEIFNAEKFEELARDPKVVAVGECGLDYFRSGGTNEERTAQKERFERQIELAKKSGKSLVVHCRNAHDDCSSILQKTRIAEEVPVIIHFFTGTAEVAKQYLDQGCYLSFPGPVTYTHMYDESTRICPLDRLLIETDAPFAAPVPNRGKRNEPVYVRDVAAKVAQIKGISAAEVEQAATQNALRAFGIAPR